MQNNLKTNIQVAEANKFHLPEISPVSDSDVIAYLRRSARFAEIAHAAEREALVLAVCEELGITVSDDEWQNAGDTFRQEYKLLGIQETMTWLNQQRITAEDWSEGIRVKLLEQKLKEHLFGGTIDGAYTSNRDNYRRVALSQILVTDVATAWKIAQQLREQGASFCALALEYSKGRLSHDNGGFVGTRYLVELTPEVAEAIKNVNAGEIVGPIHSSLGIHILRVEKWFSVEFNQQVRDQVMEALFQVWLKDLGFSNHQG